MYTTKISDVIKSVCPNFTVAVLVANIDNSPSSDQLWNDIDAYISRYKKDNTFESVKNNPNIAATRKTYKTLGKDPNRYRPSAEALCRRIINGSALYRVNTVVDIINFVSIQTGFSIGGFDSSKISGKTLTLGVGKANEPYESIGRGLLNIENLPVFRDKIGGIGTPTSDNNRTKLDISTTALLITINGYNGKEGLEEAVSLMISLLRKYAKSSNEEILYI